MEKEGGREMDRREGERENWERRKRKIQGRREMDRREGGKRGREGERWKGNARESG